METSIFCKKVESFIPIGYRSINCRPSTDACRKKQEPFTISLDEYRQILGIYAVRISITCLKRNKPGNYIPIVSIAVAVTATKNFQGG